MPKSMTAFGRAETSADWGKLSCELRSVNHRYLELGIRLPEELRGLEPKIRETISAVCSRGKVDCGFRLNLSAQSVSDIQINQTAADALLAACNKVSKQFPKTGEISPLDILNWPGLVQETELDAQPLWQAAMVLLEQVLTDFLGSREREGEATKLMLAERCDAIAELLIKQRAHNPDAMTRLREKLLTRLADLDIEADTGRLEQELVFLAQKLDIDEEIDRLDTHITETRRVLKLKEPIGRRLDFIMQEFHREANTLGSKASDPVTTQTAIDLKVLIEQMREQVQNLE